jgi:hypothetical protein
LDGRPAPARAGSRDDYVISEFRLPYDDTMPLEMIAAEASRVMRLLIERTWPFMEPILKNEKAGHLLPNE